jgi:hypothetical protein
MQWAVLIVRLPAGLSRHRIAVWRELVVPARSFSGGGCGAAARRRAPQPGRSHDPRASDDIDVSAGGWPPWRAVCQRSVGWGARPARRQPLTNCFGGLTGDPGMEEAGETRATVRRAMIPGGV